jgi:hypothetical protein
MGSRNPEYGSMSLGKLEHLAGQGDEGAQQALQGFAAEIGQTMQDLRIPDLMARVSADQAEMKRSIDDVTKLKAQEKREAVEREEAILRELGLMRRAALRADEREAAAIKRAVEAEAREVVAQERADKRERFLVRVTVASAVFGGIGALAAVVAIFA